MKKCDFCTQSSPRGRCFWATQSTREPYCKKAISMMVCALQGQTEKIKKRGR